MGRKGNDPTVQPETRRRLIRFNKRGFSSMMAGLSLLAGAALHARTEPLTLALILLLGGGGLSAGGVLRFLADRRERGR
jgi:hypothetical protein